MQDEQETGARLSRITPLWAVRDHAVANDQAIDSKIVQKSLEQIVAGLPDFSFRLSMATVRQRPPNRAPRSSSSTFAFSRSKGGDYKPTGQVRLTLFSPPFNTVFKRWFMAHFSVWSCRFKSWIILVLAPISAPRGWVMRPVHDV